MVEINWKLCEHDDFPVCEASIWVFVWGTRKFDQLIHAFHKPKEALKYDLGVKVLGWVKTPGILVNIQKGPLKD